MSVHTFDSTKEFLDELLKKVTGGRIQLPDFQRGWVWSQLGTTSLLAPISLGYPVGTLMLLRTGGDATFRHRRIEGAQFSRSRLDTLRTRNSAAYKGIDDFDTFVSARAEALLSLVAEAMNKPVASGER